MKMKYLITILLALTFFCSTNSSDNVSNLWTKEFLGKPYDVRFTDSDQILISTTKGIISKLKADNGEVSWRKNMIYNTNFEVDGKGQYCLLVNKENRYVDLINNQNSQLIWSISFGKNNSRDELKGLKWRLLNKDNTFLGVLFESQFVKIFSSEMVLADIEAADGEEFLDFLVDENEENLLVLSVTQKRKFEIKQYGLQIESISSKFNKILLSKDLAVNKDADDQKYSDVVKSHLMTKDYFFVLFDNYSYLYMNYNKEQEITRGLLDVNDESRGSISLTKFNNSNAIVLNNSASNSLIILSMRTNKVNIVNIQKGLKEEYLIDYVENSKISSIYLFKKKNSNSFILYEIDLLRALDYLELKEISSHTINEEINIISFIMNPYDQKNYFIVSKENRIYFLKRNENNYKWKNDQSLANLQFSQLITYFKEEEDEKVHSYNDFNSFFRKREFLKVFVNIFNNFLTDMFEIFLRIKNNISNLSSFDKNTKDSTSTNQKLQHYLIMFTKDSEELFLIDAISGEMKLTKHFKNKQLIKIYKDPTKSNSKSEKDIYLIFKDKSIESNLQSYHLNLDTKVLSEEKRILDYVQFKEKLEKQSDDLIKNESDRSNVELSYENSLTNSDFIKKFVNKYKIKTNNKGLYGIKLSKNNKLSLAWSINTKPFHIQFPNVHNNVITTYHSAGKVFYKYIDSNLLLTLTNLSNKTLLVNVILATNGKVLYQSSISNVDFSQDILSVFEENMILISYMKKEKNVRRNEVHAIEIMKREIEHSLLHMLEKIFKLDLFTDNVPQDQHIFTELQESDLVFLTHTYVTSRKIKGMFTTQTLLNVENKYFVFLFENNQVFLVDKRGVSPRRPLVKEDKSKPGIPTFDPMNSPYVDPELSPYTPLLAFDYKQILNVDFFTNQIENILISPTQFESTFILCAEGANLSCYKVSPDKTFDALSVSFSYGQIALSLSLVISIAILLRRYVKKNEFKNIFLASS